MCVSACVCSLSHVCVIFYRVCVTQLTEPPSLPPAFSAGKSKDGSASSVCVCVCGLKLLGKWGLIQEEEGGLRYGAWSSESSML